MRVRVRRFLAVLTDEAALFLCHDGRCPTLRDSVEFFNLVLELKLNEQEKADLVAYMLCL